MNQFIDYAFFYDLFYENKNYADEVEFLDNIIKQYTPDVKSILDLGCGTGKHAILLAGKDFEIVGVDLSEQMLERAKINASALSNEHQSNIKFYCSDINNLRLNREFDFIYSLFHVVSYQTSDDAIYKTIDTVRHHLKNDGLFVFDVWYGPGVLENKPKYLKKEFVNGKSVVNKIAKPVFLPDKNIVIVEYTIDIKNENRKIVEEHILRYYFKPELDLILKEYGMEIICVFDGFTNSPPDENTWSATFITKKTV